MGLAEPVPGSQWLFALHTFQQIKVHGHRSGANFEMMVADNGGTMVENDIENGYTMASDGQVVASNG